MPGPLLGNLDRLLVVRDSAGCLGVARLDDAEVVRQVDGPPFVRFVAGLPYTRSHPACSGPDVCDYRSVDRGNWDSSSTR